MKKNSATENCGYEEEMPQELNKNEKPGETDKDEKACDEKPKSGKNYQ